MRLPAPSLDQIEPLALVLPPEETDGAAAGFHALSTEYDTVFTSRPLGRALRGRVWEHLDARFSVGEHVLDLGCGTGEDAVHMAMGGVRVTAVDAAAGMVAETRRKVALAGLQGRVRLVHDRMENVAELVTSGTVHGDARPTPSSGGQVFDGAYADFGALNCVADMPVFGRSLAAILRPRAMFVAVVMGPISPWEIVWHAAHCAPRAALRRLRREGVSAQIQGHAFTVRYPSPSTFARQMSPQFRLVGIEGLGVVLPPTYAATWLENRTALLARAAGLDRFLSRNRVAANFADHYIATLERRP